MWSTLSSVLRLVVCAAVALCALAVLLGRTVPEQYPDLTRVFEPARAVAINRGLMLKRTGGADFYDPGTGLVSRMELAEDQSLDFAALSPWRDGAGKRQVAGLLSRYVSRGVGRTLDAAQLTRMSFPDGRILNAVEVAVNPIGDLCWAPDTSSRVIFAGADGSLYQVHFDDRDGDGIDLPAGSLERLTWDARPTGHERVLLCNPCWPADPRFARTLLVSLKPQADDPGKPSSPAVLWWLQLSHDGLRIVDAGPLMGIPTPRSQLSPTVVTTPEGSTLLAYLSRGDERDDWAMHVAPLEIDRQTGIPHAAAGKTFPLNALAHPNAPAFSLDGRWVACLMPVGRTEPVAVRIRVGDFGQDQEALAARSPAAATHD